MYAYHARGPGFHPIKNKTKQSKTKMTIKMEENNGLIVFIVETVNFLQLSQKKIILRLSESL